MLHLIPAPLHRAGLTLAHAVRIRWWQWRKPLLIGCRVLAFDEAERVLLIRHSYGSGRWMLPGGGVDRGEDPLAAALRELARTSPVCTSLQFDILELGDGFGFLANDRFSSLSGGDGFLFLLLEFGEALLNGG